MKKNRFITMLSFTFLIFFAPGANAAKQDSLIIKQDDMLNAAAPNFKLRDLKGKTVRLSDYRGKTLILDFWATWCEPCRKSFPIMKIVMAKFKNDPQVKFLFIDTKESQNTRKVKKILATGAYPFPVIFDQAEPKSTRYTTFINYKMPGIPAKYIIDSKGIIRFTELGFNYIKPQQELADELSSQILHIRNM